ncbi:hypothetical protein, partial [Aeromonas salmonicida]|uniref:hypothetical protein n=1 Tax=Aeromonas salmonicida TaxID=645 RepID=UPI0035A6CB88
FLKNDYLFRMKFIDQMMGLKKSFFYKLESCHLASMCAVYHKINQSFYLYETKEISHVNASLMKLMKLNIVRHGFNMIYSFLWKVFF